MEKQLVFDFVKQNNILEGKTCRSCKFYNIVCGKFEEDTFDENTCGDYEFDNNKFMDEMAHDAKSEFVRIMEKYNVSQEDGKTIYICCQQF